MKYDSLRLFFKLSSAALQSDTKPANLISDALQGIDLTDNSFLPNSLVSMLTNFRITSSDGNYIPMFSES